MLVALPAQPVPIETNHKRDAGMADESLWVRSCFVLWCIWHSCLPGLVGPLFGDPKMAFTVSFFFPHDWLLRIFSESLILRQFFDNYFKFDHFLKKVHILKF